MRCLVTGATGYIGQSLIPHLFASGHDVTVWPRSHAFDFSNERPPLGEWIKQLHNADVVVHLAGLAHQTRKATDASPYFRINRDGTLHLAAAAQAAGVKRFIFLSTAKVLGDGGEILYCHSSHPHPIDAYAQSKWEAEQQLLRQFSQTMEIVILRPPLVYGRKAKANFASLMKLAKLPIPLPLAGIDNRRAMIGIDNLIDLIMLCLTSPTAAGKALLCADSRLYSLPDIVISIRRSLNRDPNLFRLPLPLFIALKQLLGKSIEQRLFGDFKMDCRESFETLNWTPPLTMDQILRGDIENTRA